MTQKAKIVFSAYRQNVLWKMAEKESLRHTSPVQITGINPFFLQFRSVHPRLPQVQRQRQGGFSTGVTRIPGQGMRKKDYLCRLKQPII